MTEAEASDCLAALQDRRLKRANRYRVGKSWPRGAGRIRAGRWKCSDCTLTHMWWKDACPVSNRPRQIAEAKKAELGITDKSKLGMLVGAVMKETAGKADGGDVKAAVESLFN